MIAAVIASLFAASGIVPDDFPTIQAALDQASPGDVLRVRDQGTPYFERVRFARGGTAAQGFVSLEAQPGDRPILDGTGSSGSDMVLIDTLSWVRVRGFEIRNLLGARDGSGVRILGSGSHIEIRDNIIHDIRGTDAMGITVYGTDPTTSISDLVIDGNTIHDCEPARSEALTLNGNVERFTVSNNVVRDVNNIGIDLIGGETSICPDPTRVARDGVVRFNRVERAKSIYGGGYAGGIYVDGGRDIVIENNIVTGSDLGIEIGAENAGTDATGIVVRNNLVYRNEKAGIVFGGYAAGVGRTRNSAFLNNTTFENDLLGEGLGELWIQFAEDNVVRNNIFVSTAQNVLLYSEAGNINNSLDWNLWHAPGGDLAAEWIWRGVSRTGHAALVAASGQDGNGQVATPMFVDPVVPDLHVTPGSPAIDGGDPSFTGAAGEIDIDGGARVVNGRVDAGADESAPACLVTALGRATLLQATRLGAGVRFEWQPEPGAPEHHLNAVAAKADLAAPGAHRPPVAGARATAECDAPAPVTGCTDADAIGDPRPTLFYRVIAACGGGGDREGPAD